jgi:hypothetical protein
MRHDYIMPALRTSSFGPKRAWKRNCSILKSKRFFFEQKNKKLWLLTGPGPRPEAIMDRDGVSPPA